MIKKNVTEFTCDSCGKTESMHNPGYNQYPDGWITPYSSETFSFYVGGIDHHVPFTDTIFCSQQCAVDYFQKALAMALEPKNEPLDESTGDREVGHE